MRTPPRRLSPPSPSRGRRSESGSVSLELAAALPALLIVSFMCLWGILAGSLKLRCDDAARMSVRAIARGDDTARVRSAALAAVGHDATFTAHHSGSSVTVLVTGRAPYPAVLRRVLPAFTVHASATAPVEKQ